MKESVRAVPLEWGAKMPLLAPSPSSKAGIKVLPLLLAWVCVLSIGMGSGSWSLLGSAAAQEAKSLPASVLNRLNAVIATKSRANANGIDLRLNNPNGDFVEGERAVIKITGPRFPAYLYLDHFKSDGSVVHLMSGPIAGDEAAQARQEFVVRRTASDQPIVMGPAPNQELIVLLASPEPLLVAPRPEKESAREYLEALKPQIYGLPQPEPNEDLTVVFQYISSRKGGANDNVIATGESSNTDQEAIESPTVQGSAEVEQLTEVPPPPAPPKPEAQTATETEAGVAPTSSSPSPSSPNPLPEPAMDLTEALIEPTPASPDEPADQQDVNAALSEEITPEKEETSSKNAAAQPAAEEELTSAALAIVAQKEGDDSSGPEKSRPALLAEADLVAQAAEISALLATLETNPASDETVSKLVSAYGDLGEILIAREEPSKARHSIAMAMALDPDNERIARLEQKSIRMAAAQNLMQQGIAHLAAGDAMMAYDAFDKVLAVQPENDLAMKHKASIQPTMTELYHQRAVAAYQANNLTKAVTLWDQLLSIDPAHEEARVQRDQALERLNQASQ
ncbi:MAG: hypothetical protein AAF530_18145 [Pseudomonadota bacterium]